MAFFCIPGSYNLIKPLEYTYEIYALANLKTSAFLIHFNYNKSRTVISMAIVFEYNILQKLKRG